MKSKSVVLNLKRLFYIAFVIQIIFFVGIAFKWINIAPSPHTIPDTIQRYALLITLIGIPGALKLYQVMMKNNKHRDDEMHTISLYKKAFIARFGILFLVASLNIGLYALSPDNKNFMPLVLITFIAYFFSYPSKNYLLRNNSTEDNEEIAKNNPKQNK